MNDILTPITDSNTYWASNEDGEKWLVVDAKIARQLERELHLERARTARAISILKQCVLKKDETDMLDALANTVMCNLKELADAGRDYLCWAQMKEEERLRAALDNIPDDL